MPTEKEIHATEQGIECIQTICLSEKIDRMRVPQMRRQTPA